MKQKKGKCYEVQERNNTMKQIRMHGKGGQGVVTGGEILSNAYLIEGMYMAVMPSYGVERRGSDVTAFGRLSETPVRENALSYVPDYLIIFDPSQISKAKTYEGFPEGGVIVACGTDPEQVLAMGVKPSKIVMVDGIRIAYEVTGNNLTNMIMCGAYAKAGLISIDAAMKAIEENLPKNFVKTSVLGCQRGYDEAKVYKYDYKESSTAREPLWNTKVLECKKPEPCERESPWGNYENVEDLIVLPTGTWKVTRPVVDMDLCVKCGICATFCPTQCISKSADGYYFANLNFCKGCGVCAHECPKKAISMKLDSDFKD